MRRVAIKSDLGGRDLRKWREREIMRLTRRRTRITSRRMRRTTMKRMRFTYEDNENEDKEDEVHR